MLYSALILGLLSSLHCIGMCGPIAMMLPVDRDNQAKKAIQIMLYHFGRLTAYGSLGLVFGIIGKGLYLAGMQQQLSIIAGLIMIVIAVVPERIFARYNFSKPVYRVIAKVKSGLGKQFTKRSYKALFITGLLNGFLPCAMVYAALFGAISMQNEVLGVTYMILYGLGTIPLMTAVVYASGFMSTSLRNSLNKIVPYAAVFIGMLFIIRGLGLGIPFLSPSDVSLFVQSNPDCGIIDH
ncbi:MAG: hypothetical protein BM557_05780 [Flavobacterium sp. MedPE-SWcel]|uniref:sulfite exporter TauE/SafE family protein n=1 Tax=uncultured Flavobacterium sp. TaxID=165435 RepID=UPI000920F70A|nr:sulfite exporter TauE/SafE family protein [uncultured Flavobacterium sp.]OIQ20178.1 MAG: hypothetical protein BM557_05780 [Flavobacterium sp. MedPE-SWcel]